MDEYVVGTSKTILDFFKKKNPLVLHHKPGNHWSTNNGGSQAVFRLMCGEEVTTMDI